MLPYNFMHYSNFCVNKFSCILIFCIHRTNNILTCSITKMSTSQSEYIYTSYRMKVEYSSSRVLYTSYGMKNSGTPIFIWFASIVVSSKPSMEHNERITSDSKLYYFVRYSLVQLFSLCWSFGWGKIYANWSLWFAFGSHLLRNVPRKKISRFKLLNTWGQLFKSRLASA